MKTIKLTPDQRFNLKVVMESGQCRTLGEIRILNKVCTKLEQPAFEYQDVKVLEKGEEKIVQKIVDGDAVDISLEDEEYHALKSKWNGFDQWLPTAREKILKLDELINGAGK